MQCHEGFFLQMTSALRILADCADQAGILFFFPSHACDGAVNDSYWLRDTCAALSGWWSLIVLHVLLLSLLTGQFLRK